MPVASPVSERLTVAALLMLTFATGHVFVANMTGNVIFTGFWFVPHSGVDPVAALVAFVSFVVGTVVGGRLRRHLNNRVKVWPAVATLTLVTVAPVIAAVAVAAAAAIFQFGPSAD
jgi:uncharacterized membrane protein YoaK (UPF0700 family)